MREFTEHEAWLNVLAVLERGGSDFICPVIEWLHTRERIGYDTRRAMLAALEDEGRMVLGDDHHLAAGIWLKGDPARIEWLRQRVELTRPSEGEAVPEHVPSGHYIEGPDDDDERPEPDPPEPDWDDIRESRDELKRERFDYED